MKKLILFLGVISGFSAADEGVEYSRLDCAPALGYFKFDYGLIYSRFTVDNAAQKDFDKNRLSSFKDEKCVLPSGTLEIKFESVGKLNNDYYMSLFFDGKKIFDQLYLPIAGYNSYGHQYELYSLKAEYLDNSDGMITAKFIATTSNKVTKVYDVPVGIQIDPKKQRISKQELVETLNKRIIEKLKYYKNAE